MDWTTLSTLRRRSCISYSACGRTFRGLWPPPPVHQRRGGPHTPTRAFAATAWRELRRWRATYSKVCSRRRRRFQLAWSGCACGGCAVNIYIVLSRGFMYSDNYIQVTRKYNIYIIWKKTCAATRLKCTQYKLKTTKRAHKKTTLSIIHKSWIMTHKTNVKQRKWIIFSKFIKHIHYYW